jgi:protocatechuate 3,4-dioxygenase alpha subunit
MGDPAPAGVTPGQTVGPFLHLVLADPAARFAVPAGTAGEIVVHGVVLDGDGVPVPDAVVETWQVDAHFGRCATDRHGHWEIHTVKPPPAPTRDGTAQAPHLCVSVFARGLLDRVVTRCYFADEASANATDPTLHAVPAERRSLLVAAVDGDGRYGLDIRLQGDDESVFFDV